MYYASLQGRAVSSSRQSPSFFGTPHSKRGLPGAIGCSCNSSSSKSAASQQQVSLSNTASCPAQIERLVLPFFPLFRHSCLHGAFTQRMQSRLRLLLEQGPLQIGSVGAPRVMCAEDASPPSTCAPRPKMVVAPCLSMPFPPALDLRSA